MRCSARHSSTPTSIIQANDGDKFTFMMFNFPHDEDGNEHGKVFIIPDTEREQTTLEQGHTSEKKEVVLVSLNHHHYGYRDGRF